MYVTINSEFIWSRDEYLRVIGVIEVVEYIIVQGSLNSTQTGPYSKFNIDMITCIVIFFAFYFGSGLYVTLIFMFQIILILHSYPLTSSYLVLRPGTMFILRV